MEIDFYTRLDDMPAAADAIWRAAERETFFLSRWWFETVIAGALDAGDNVATACLHDRQRPLALLPCRFPARAGWLGGQRLQSITGMYSCLFRPLIADREHEEPLAHALGTALGRALHNDDLIQFDAMASDWSPLGAFQRGLREAGFVSMQYDHFVNWSEPLSARSFPQYMSGRDAALREILRRKGRAAARGGAEFRIVTAPDDIEAGIADYDSVYGQSWKIPEPYPDFNALLMRRAAAEGALRLGICVIAGKPVAVQLWIIWNGTATILKLAHDKAVARLSVGTLLTAYMIEEMMDRDRVAEIDFGRGDDAYKRLWTSRRRRRIGLIAANPRSLAGSIQIARQMLPRGLRVLRRLGQRNAG